MKKEDWRKIFYQSLTGFVSLALAILLFFAIREIGQIRSSFQWLLGVLKPVIYGAVMAYLLKTPCNFLEKRIEALLPEKKKTCQRVNRSACDCFNIFCYLSAA